VSHPKLVTAWLRAHQHGVMPHYAGV